MFNSKLIKFEINYYLKLYFKNNKLNFFKRMVKYFKLYEK